MKCKHLIIVSVAIIALSAATPRHPAARSLTDQLGRQVVLPDDPQRIVSLAPSITEIIFALGQEHRLRGVTRYSDFPPDAAKFPKVGSYVYLDLERIVALRPDLCIAVKDGNPKKVIDKLEAMKIPVYAVDPRNLETVAESVIEIGRLLNAGEKADALVMNMRSRIQRVISLVAKTAYRPRVFFQIGISPVVAVGTNTFIHELITFAGGRNLSQGPVPYPRYSREQIITLSPEVFIITSMARGEVFERVKAEWQQWAAVPAVRNNRIFLVNSDIFDRGTPRLADGLELLFRLIHPELAEETK
ncbi:cobalamin-binding protein [Desulfobacterales bacterium HSG2]|nr:cobalamin-binding protein [Desulfobacterales bacterium HSG2]